LPKEGDRDGPCLLRRTRGPVLVTNRQPRATRAVNPASRRLRNGLPRPRALTGASSTTSVTLRDLDELLGPARGVSFRGVFLFRPPESRGERPRTAGRPLNSAEIQHSRAPSKLSGHDGPTVARDTPRAGPSHTSTQPAGRGAIGPGLYGPWSDTWAVEPLRPSASRQPCPGPFSRTPLKAAPGGTASDLLRRAKPVRATLS